MIAASLALIFLACSWFCTPSQVKYKRETQSELANCLYAQMPLTSEIQFAKEQSEALSEVGTTTIEC